MSHRLRRISAIAGAVLSSTSALGLGCSSVGLAEESTDGGGTTGADATTGGDTGTPADAGHLADATHDDASLPKDAGADATDAAPAHFDVTFYVMADSHADPVPEDDLLSQARAINAVSQTGVWPASIGGTATQFVGGPIAPPLGVVICGDLTGWGTAPTEIPMFRSYFEKGNSPNSIDYPAYVGLGNHDIDTADRDEATADAYRAIYWQYVDSRYMGSSAPIPVTSYDPASHNYSWDWGGVHLVMTHRFAGDTEYGLASSLGWLADDLQQHAGDGRPVFVFHHYGADAFGTDGQWWNAADRYNYRKVLTGYHVTADMTGHTHYAFSYPWDGLNVQQVNNAKAEIDAGNNDGKGSFAIVRVTETRFDLVTCRWTDDQGHFELIEPYYSGPSDPGPAPATTLVPAGDFASTCTDVALQGSSVLSATCQTVSGTQTTTLDLDECITNSGGNLMWNGSNFDGSCSGCALSGTLLTCECSPVSGAAQSTTIDVDNGVTNCSGTLTCGPC